METDMHPIFEKICGAISGDAMKRAASENIEYGPVFGSTSDYAGESFKLSGVSITTKSHDVYEVAAERLRTIDTAKTVSHEEMKERFSDSDAELLISELNGGEK